MALSDAPDARVAFCRKLPDGPCACSVEAVETHGTPEEVTALLRAMQKGGAVSVAEMQQFEHRRAAACDTAAPAGRHGAGRQAPIAKP